MRINKKIVINLFVAILIAQNCAFAQDLTAARYEIDAKRIGVYSGDKDALPRSREFVRLDSTYYVGWMFEGLYKYERSGDYLGYKYAITPLKKALYLFEKDFGSKMHNIFTSLAYFNQHQQRFDDFYQIVNTLKLCYNSIEMPDSTMALLDKFESYHFQRDFMSIDTERSWIYHRCRFFTSKEHSFLGNSINENEELAFKSCYKQISEINRNKGINDFWYGQNQSEDDLLTVYHYLAILHNYNQHYDSAEYYYNLLEDGGRISWSNYANMQHEIGNFSNAIELYGRPQFRRKFALVEADYYLPMMLIYGGRTKEAMELSKQKISETGSTPGFGWYTIGLARGYLYDGQLDSCDFFLTKAGNFKELHINTTLTQSQYEFTINLLRIQLIEKKSTLIKFYNPGWWYNVFDLYDFVSLKIEKLLLEYAIVNALANNPERKRIVYDLFCAETTVTFDESLFLLKDFSLPYFIKKYNYYLSTDPRLKIRKYFRLFSLRFLLEGGETDITADECYHLINESISQNNIQDVNVASNKFEKLYKARLYETYALSLGEGKKQDESCNNFFNEFPTLVPFSGLKMKMNVEFTGDYDELIKNITEDIKDFNIEYVNSPNVPRASINFSKAGLNYLATINVIDATGKQIVSNAQIIFKSNNDIAKEIALKMFGKGGAVKF